MDFKAVHHTWIDYKTVYHTRINYKTVYHTWMDCVIGMTVNRNPTLLIMYKSHYVICWNKYTYCLGPIWGFNEIDRFHQEEINISINSISCYYYQDVVISQTNWKWMYIVGQNEVNRNVSRSPKINRMR